MTALPDGGRRRLTALLGGVVTAGVSVAVAAPLAWGVWGAQDAGTGSPSAVGPPLAGSVEPPASGAAASPLPEPLMPPAPPVPPAPVLPVLRVSAPAPAVAAGAPAPVRLRIPDLRIDAPVEPVGLTGDGAVHVPDDGAHTGWWSAGAAPGDDGGSTVVVGHVDTEEGPGALYRLGRADLGQHVVVTDAAGAERTYAVTARAQVRKAELPGDLFATSGPPRLVLISCGGAFDERTRHYADNVVVVAEPVG